jgi:hypothetical protein
VGTDELLSLIVEFPSNRAIDSYVTSKEQISPQIQEKLKIQTSAIESAQIKVW